MAFPPPSRDDLVASAAKFAISLTDEDLDTYLGLVKGSVASYDLVEHLYGETVSPVPEARQSSLVEAADNPLGAWYARTEITGTPGGALDAVRVAIKDNISVAGVPMMNGSRTVEGFVPSYDATVVTRLLEAGATVVGKAVCESLCFSGASHTSDSGPVRNPWDPTRTSGGSSSGCAALVATAQVDMAIGGDQGGSVRIPSSFCGTVGHKPTWGLVPYTGAFPIELTIDHLGPMTRTVADAALMLRVLAGPDGLDPRQPNVIEPVDYVAALEEPVNGLRVGLLTEGFGHPNSDPGVDASVRAATEVLRSEGLKVEEISIPWHLDAMHVWNVIATEGAAYQMIDGNAYGMNYKGLYDPELIAHYHRYRLERGAQLSKTVK